MTTTSDARKRLTPAPDPVEVEYGIQFSNGRLWPMDSRAAAEQELALVINGIDSFAHLVVRELSPWRTA